MPSKNILSYNVLINFIEFVIALSMVLNCSSVYVSEYGAYWIGKIVLVLFCLGLLSLCLLAFNTLEINNRKYIKYNIIFMGYLLIYLAFRHNNIGVTISFFAELILLGNYLIITGKEGIANILKQYSDVIVIISMISLFFWCFGSVLHIIEPTGQIYSNWKGEDSELSVFKGYLGLHFETQSIDMFDDVGMLRNTSIFNEGPMYSLHLSLALLTQLFIVKKIYTLKVFVILLTIVTTMSSTGYVLAMGAIFIRLNMLMNNYKAFKYLRILLFLFFSAVIAYVIWRLFNFRADTISGLIRFDDYLVAFDTWKSSPIFGAGIGNYDALKQNMEAWRAINTGYSNSIGLMLAEGGLWFTLPMMYIFFKNIIGAYLAKEKKSIGSSVCFLYLTFFALGIFNFNMLCFFAYLVANINSDLQ